MAISFFLVIPAKAGIQCLSLSEQGTGSRLSPGWRAL